MSRIHANAISGTLSSGLTAGGTTMSATALALLPAVVAPDVAVIVLDPDASAGAPEVVYVTAHTASATSATIARAQETDGGLSAVGRTHASAMKWVHSMSKADFTGGTPAASAPGDTAVTGTAGQWADKDHKHAREAVDGSTVEVNANTLRVKDGGISTAKIADSAVTSVKIADGTIATGDLADGAVTTAKIADATIATGDLADGAVTSAKIANGTIVAADIADATITAAKMDSSFLGDYLKLDSIAAVAPTTVTAVGNPAATPTTIAGTTVTMDCTRAGQVFLIWGSVDVTYTGGTGAHQEAVTALSVDNSNTLTNPQIIGRADIEGVPLRVTLSQMWQVSGLSVASHTFRLKGFKLNALDTVTVSDTHTKLNVLRVG